MTEKSCPIMTTFYRNRGKRTEFKETFTFSKIHLFGRHFESI